MSYTEVKFETAESTVGCSGKNTKDVRVPLETDDVDRAGNFK